MRKYSMRKLILLFVSLIPLTLIAQQTAFMFEDSSVPSDWQTQQGTLSVTGNHYKEGVQSLSWETTGGEATLLVSTRNFNTKGRGFMMHLRAPEITNDVLKIEFLDSSNQVHRTANVSINFKGWRELIRMYSEFSETSTFALKTVRFTLLPTNQTPRKLFFDNVNFNTDVINKNFGGQWVLDKDKFTADNLSLNEFGYPIDIPITTPTAQELNELSVLRSRFQRELESDMNLLASRNLVNSYKIVRNDDGSVRGNVLDCSKDALTTTAVRNILGALQTLAGSSNAADEQRFLDLVDHMLEQGLSEGVSLRLSSSSYSDARYIPASILNLVPYLQTDERKIEMLKLARWMSEYGKVYLPEDMYLSRLNSDLIYNYLPHMYGYAVLQPNDAVAIRELKALKRHLERHTEVVPGTSDMIKIDGTGFHHWTHYNNYMYCYSTWAEYIYQLRETSFNIKSESYYRLRDALMAVLKMANKKEGNKNHFFANALAGRNPYIRGGINVPFNGDKIQGLVTASETILGSMDEYLAGAYNYFYMSDVYDVPAVNMDGYYQFNYSPLGVYRKNNWVVSMRSPTAYFWGAEIYSQQNRFGRYQSHGTLEVVYTGEYARSGIPTTTGSGGWDWNVVPGTTTVHYDSWLEMMPNKNVTDRFDQKAPDTHFVGALAAGNSGVFAADFNQGDNWGSQRFTPTNLKFKKSVFTFDSVFVCLGTNISAQGSYSANMHTATNLFQEVQSSYFSDFIINGNVFQENDEFAFENSKNYWMLTPLGTGYYIPKNNDPLVVKFGSQTSPRETGVDVSNPTYTVTAAKAYIQHGVKPASKDYRFFMIPNTTQTAMENFAAKVGDTGGDVFVIESQTEKLHAVTNLDMKMTSYAFFDAVSNLSFGYLESASTEMLLVIKRDEPKNRLHISINNPNLRPVPDTDFGFLSTPTQTTIKLKGVWKLLQDNESVLSMSNDGKSTTINLVLAEGEPVYFSLGDMDDTNVKQPQDHDDWVSILDNKDSIHLSFLSQTEGKEKNIQVFTLNGSLFYTDKTSNSSFIVDKKVLPQGFFVMRVSENKKFKVIKVIN